MIGSDGQWQNFFLATVVDANLSIEGVHEPGIPLMQQIDGGRNHHGRAIHAMNGLNRQEGLASSSGQDDTATLSRMIPGCQGLYLVIVWLAHLVQSEIERSPAWNRILDSELA